MDAEVVPRVIERRLRQGENQSGSPIPSSLHRMGKDIHLMIPLSALRHEKGANVGLSRPWMIRHPSGVHRCLSMKHCVLEIDAD